MKQWDELVNIGMLGTQQQSFQLSTAGKELARWLQPNQVDAPEKCYLDAVALLGQYRLAGSQSSASRALPKMAASPDERLPACGNVTSTHLQTLINDNNIELLIELLSLLKKHAQRFDFKHLPTLLDLAVKHGVTRPLVASLAGERGRWLSQLNPQWNSLFAGKDDGVASWHEDSLPLRLQTLRTLTMTDPEQSRRLLQKSWKQESAKDRLGFLEILRDSLSPDDTGFLKQCLQDRSQKIRWEAAQQLAILADDELAATVEQIVLPLLSIKSSLIRPQLKIALPAKFDPNWEQYGLREKVSTPFKMGQKAGWLWQWLQLITPTRLAAGLGTDRVKLVKAITASDYSEAVLDALDHAAATLGDKNYVELRLTATHSKDFDEVFTKFAKTLSHAQRIQIVLDHMKKHKAKCFEHWHDAARLLNHCKPLSASLTRLFLTTSLPQLAKNAYGYSSVGRELGGLLAVECYPEFKKRLEQTDEDTVLPELLSTFRFRYQFYQEFL